MPITVSIPSGVYPLVYADMLKQPHLLVAGKTGSGKSCLINGLIRTAMFTSPRATIGSPSPVSQFILIDPKRVELAMYKDLPHTLFHATEPGQFAKALQYSLNLANTRFKDMERRRIKKYDGGDVYVIIDEFADLMSTSRKTVQPLVQRLCQIGRAAKIHVILATQCPLAKIIPTEIKCNFESRVALKTASRRDSRNILDSIEAHDAAFYLPDPLIDHRAEVIYVSPVGPVRVEMPLYSDEELETLVKFWLDQKIPRQTLATV